ncbi:ABC transporter ATP-binding protein [Nitrosopumilus sp.]|nr:ABC transporter ATP-binding protein [Nitrosopumilus sp.]
MTEILKIENLKKYYIKKKIFSSDSSIVKATDRISFSIKKGEVFVLAGESGSGKSTIAKLILKAIPADEGKIIFEDQEIDEQKKNLQKIRMNCQMIHQDPYDSINPRMKIKDIILEPLEIHNVGNKEERHRRLLEVLKEVKLEPVEEIMKKYPHMLSGGQRQRVVLARALALKPKIILADEPVSMLDVSIRAEMLELMKQLQEKYQISFIYITHDLATAKYFGQRIAILYLGKIVEIGPINQVLESPKHPYTQALIDAISEPDPSNIHKIREIRIKESDTEKSVKGCRFKSRCPYAIEQCDIEPNLEEIENEHFAACHVELN